MTALWPCLTRALTSTSSRNDPPRNQNRAVHCTNQRRPGPTFTCRALQSLKHAALTHTARPPRSATLTAPETKSDSRHASVAAAQPCAGGARADIHALTSSKTAAVRGRRLAMLVRRFFSRPSGRTCRCHHRGLHLLARCAWERMSGSLWSRLRVGEAARPQVLRREEHPGSRRFWHAYRESRQPIALVRSCLESLHWSTLDSSESQIEGAWLLGDAKRPITERRVTFQFANP